MDVSLPDTDYPLYCITAIAMNPSKKRKGLGSQVLQQLIRLPKFNQSNTWIAHVATDNIGGIRFLRKMVGSDCR